MGHTAHVTHQMHAAAMRAKPGTWHLVHVYAAAEGGRGAAHRIPRATRMPSYEPAGTFEAYSAPHDNGGTAVWARYTGGLTTVIPRPVSMTYRVCDHGSGPGYVGVRIETVVVSAECPTCGGPRAQARPSRFHKDGDWYSADRWDNPCGHIDSYAAVLAEFRKRQAELEEAEQRDAARAVGAGPAEAGEFTDAVLLLNGAASEIRGLHAKQAAVFLAMRGETEAARLIQEELAERSGRMSARQAAVFLVDLAAARAEDADRAEEDARAEGEGDRA